MYEKILVPVDGSKSAEAALPYAEELARKLGSQITLVSVLSSGSQKGRAQYKHLHQFYMQEMVKTSKQREPVINKVILNGDPADEIADYAHDNNFDLIIMGTRGRSALKRWVLGSVADKVVSVTSCPVALICSEDTGAGVFRSKILRKALVILDGTDESEVIVPYAEALSSKLGMEMILLQIVDQAYEYFGLDDYSSIPVSKRAMGAIKAKSRRYLNETASRIEGKHIETRVEVAKGKHAETVVEVAREIDADTLFIATRGRSGLSRWFFYGIRDDIVKIGDILVFLARIPE